MIYWNVLVKSRSCYRFAQPPLTLVNNQIRRESLPVLYGNCLFFAHFGPYFPISERFQKLQAVVPAIPNLAYITKLDIRFSFGLMGFSKERGVDVFICMREDKLECGSLGSNNLVGEPGLEWKDRAKTEAHYRRLLENLPMGAFWKYNAKLSAMRGMKPVVRILLCFAERCPAAAEWVRMVIQWRDLVA